MHDLFALLWGTVLLRPYVFAFLAVYLVAASAQFGWKKTLVYLPLGYCLAWMSEFASIHWGFPYGDYYYIDTTSRQELWVFGVPFMDSLSYVFLSYCSYSMAVFLLSPVYFTAREFMVLETRRIRRSWKTLTLGAFLFVLLDVITDPVALQGYRWFLGQIYGYRHAGLYFGIPMSNFAGWLVVGVVMIAALQRLDRVSTLERGAGPLLERIPCVHLFGPLLYVSVLIFNLSVTFWIGELLLGLVGCVILFFPFLLCLVFTFYKREHLTREAIRRHFSDFPWKEGVSALPSLLRDAIGDHAAQIDDG